jgi:hypothetical protein
MNYMRQRIFILMIAICMFSPIASALTVSLKQKYPYSVLTNDYGILNEIDLDSYWNGVKHPLSAKKTRGYIYWQCFPRDSVKVSLEDLGDSPEDDDESDTKYNGENNGKLTITAYGKDGVSHKYSMYRDFPTLVNENRFNQYLKLMQGEKYVCLAGTYMEKDNKVNYWVFEKMKTKKGCEAYRGNGCHYD